MKICEIQSIHCESQRINFTSNVIFYNCALSITLEEIFFPLTYICIMEIDGAKPIQILDLMLRYHSLCCFGPVLCSELKYSILRMRSKWDSSVLASSCEWCHKWRTHKSFGLVLKPWNRCCVLANDVSKLFTWEVLNELFHLRWHICCSPVYGRPILKCCSKVSLGPHNFCFS